MGVVISAGAQYYKVVPLNASPLQYLLKRLQSRGLDVHHILRERGGEREGMDQVLQQQVVTTVDPHISERHGTSPSSDYVKSSDMQTIYFHWTGVLFPFKVH